MYWNQVAVNSTAVTQPNLNAEKIKEFQIPLPPKEIQEKIVVEIEVLEKKESEAKEKFEKSFTKLEAIYQNLNKFEKIDVEKISKNLDYLRKPITKGWRANGEFPYYGASGIVDYVSEFLIDDYVLLVSEDGANLKMRTQPIAFTASGKIWVNNHAHILKFKENSIHKIVEFYLNKTDISEFITGQAQPKLNQQNLNKIKIPVPPLAEQQKIVSEIEKIETQIADLEQQLSKIPKQKEEILKKYL
jgi:restriction endonuclease S subunit